MVRSLWAAERSSWVVGVLVVEKGYRGENFGMVLFYVDDVVGALQEIARRALLERKTKIIGITGSIGKTTTKHKSFVWS